MKDEVWWPIRIKAQEIYVARNIHTNNEIVEGDEPTDTTVFLRIEPKDCLKIRRSKDYFFIRVQDEAPTKPDKIISKEEICWPKQKIPRKKRKA